jgi:hypothetical protein
MQQNLAKAAIGSHEQKEKQKALDKAQGKADRLNEVAWNDKLLEANPDGSDYNQGVLDRTYAGSGKRFAELKRMINDGEGCEDESCSKEIAELDRLNKAPGETIKLLGNFQSGIDVLKEGNIDVNQPNYVRMDLASKIINGDIGYTEPDYSMEVVLNDDGSQQLIFKGEGLGENGEWSINSGNLGDGKIESLITAPVDTNEEWDEITETTPIFDRDTIDENGDFTSISPDYLSNMVTYNLDETQEAAFLEAQKTNPELTKDDWAADQDPPVKAMIINGTDNKPLRKIKWINSSQSAGDGAGSYNTQTPVYEYDENAIRASIKPNIDATVKTNFGINTDGSVDEQGANEAFQQWNQPNDGMFRHLPEELKAEIKNGDHPYFSEDGKLNWDSINIDKCKPGESCSAYNEDGTYKPELLEIFTNVYTDRYMASKVKGFIEGNKETPVPADELLRYNSEMLGFPATELVNGVRVMPGTYTSTADILAGTANTYTTEDLEAKLNPQDDDDDDDDDDTKTDAKYN